MFKAIKNMFGQKQQEIMFNDIPVFLDQELRNEEYSFMEKMKNIIPEMEKRLADLKTAVIELDSKQSGSVYANTTKSKFSKRAMEIVDTDTVSEMNYCNVKAFTAALSSRLDEINHMDFKEIVHLHAFKPEMDKISLNFKMAREKLNEIEKTLSGFSNLEKKYDIISRFEKFFEIEKNQQIMKDDILSMEKDFAYFEQKLQEEYEKLDSLLKDEKFDRIKIAESEISETEKQLKSIEQHIYTEFMSVERVLKKYQHLKGDEKDNIMNSYINDPFRAFMEDDSLEIKNRLERIEKSIMNKELDIEEKKLHRIIEIIKELDFLTTLKFQHIQLNEKLSELKKSLEDLSSIFNEKKEIENEIENLKVKIAELRKSIERKTKEASFLNEKIIEERKYIEFSAVELSGKKVSIKH